MIKRTTLAVACAIVLFSLPVSAAHCPTDLKYIDDNMMKNKITMAEMKVVMALRKFAVEAHNKGEHEVSVAALHLAAYALKLESPHKDE